MSLRQCAALPPQCPHLIAVVQCSSGKNSCTTMSAICTQPHPDRVLMVTIRASDSQPHAHQNEFHNTHGSTSTFPQLRQHQKHESHQTMKLPTELRSQKLVERASPNESRCLHLLACGNPISGAQLFPRLSNQIIIRGCVGGPHNLTIKSYPMEYNMTM